MLRADSTEVRAHIVAAWQAAVYPGDDQICTPTYDDEGVGAYFRGRTWQGHEVASLRYHDVGLSFFTAEAFAYYLAAYMLAVIDDASAADVIVDGIVFHLSPTQLGKTWRDRYLARLACLSAAQRDAAIAYLAWYASGHDEMPAEIATTIAYLRTGRLVDDVSPLARLLQLAGQADGDPQTIEWLTLSYTNVSDADLVALRDLPALRELALAGTAITDAGLAAVGTATSLETLELSSCKVSAAGLAQLATLPRLAELVIPNGELDDAHLQALASLRLRRLDVTHARRVTDAGWAALDVSRLERLDMFGVDASDSLLARIGDAGRLQKLTAKLVSDAGLVALARTPLVELDIGAAAQLTEHGLAALATLATLCELQLNTLTLERWPLGWPALQRLTLLDVALAPQLAAGLGRLPALCELRIYARRFEPDALAAAARAPTLERLTIWASHTPLALAELDGSSPALRELDVSDASITTAGLAAVARLPALATLRLSKVTLLDLAALPVLATLRAPELVLEDVDVDDAGLAELGGPHLRQLRLIRSKVTADGLAAFRAAHPTIALVDL